MRKERDSIPDGDMTKKIELINMGSSWFWCILKWNDDNKNWYNAGSGHGQTYELACEAAKVIYDNI